MTSENAPVEALEPLVDAEDAGRFLGYKPGTVRNMAAAGTIPSVKLPTGALRFRISELAAWVEGHPQTEPAA